ncbi:MAG: hypothetical protein WCY97_01555 [Methanothrix sp.]|nr:hypothetical protein [Euryarchaeota archaeon]
MPTRCPNPGRAGAIYRLVDEDRSVSFEEGFDLLLNVTDLIRPGKLNVSCNNPRSDRRNPGGSDITPRRSSFLSVIDLSVWANEIASSSRPESSSGDFSGLSLPDFAA